MLGLLGVVLRFRQAVGCGLQTVRFHTQVERNKEFYFVYFSRTCPAHMEDARDKTLDSKKGTNPSTITPSDIHFILWNPRLVAKWLKTLNCMLFSSFTYFFLRIDGQSPRKKSINKCNKFYFGHCIFAKSMHIYKQNNKENEWFNSTNKSLLWFCFTVHML